MFSHYRRRISLAVLVSPRNVSDCVKTVPMFDLVVDPNRRHGLSCMQNGRIYAFISLLAEVQDRPSKVDSDGLEGLLSFCSFLG